MAVASTVQGIMQSIPEIHEVIYSLEMEFTIFAFAFLTYLVVSNPLNLTNPTAKCVTKKWAPAVVSTFSPSASMATRARSPTSAQTCMATSSDPVLERFKGAVAANDVDCALSCFGMLSESWRAEDVHAPQSVLQHTARLVARTCSTERLPEIVALFASLRMTCETLNTLLAACVQCGDIASVQSAADMGRAKGVHFNSFTYSILLSCAAGREVIEGLLDEAMQNDVATKGIIHRAASLAAELQNTVLAKAVIARLPQMQSQSVDDETRAVANLIRAFAGSDDAAVLTLYERYCTLDAYMDEDTLKLVSGAALRSGRDNVLSRLSTKIEHARKRDASDDAVHSIAHILNKTLRFKK